MAAVTLNSSRPAKFNVTGKLKQQLYNVTGVNGSTLNVGLFQIAAVLVEPSTITAVSYANATPALGQSQITFTSSGAYTNVSVLVIGN